MAIFRFFRDSGRRHLGFSKLKRIKVRRRSKFDGNRSNRGRDIAIFFRFFKMAAATILDFRNFKSLMVGRLKRVEVRRRAKFGPNRSNCCRDMAILFIFPRWRPSAILDLLCGCLDRSRRALGGLYHCAKFGLNLCSSFDNMQV